MEKLVDADIHRPVNPSALSNKKSKMSATIPARSRMTRNDKYEADKEKLVPYTERI